MTNDEVLSVALGLDGVEEGSHMSAAVMMSLQRPRL
jgi:hypothetical protein